MRLLLTAFLATALAGCSAVGYPSPSPPPAPAGDAGTGDTPRIPLSPGGEADLSALEPEPLSRYGNPESYEVFGVTYETWPEAEGYDATGLASWYGVRPPPPAARSSIPTSSPPPTAPSPSPPGRR